MIQIVLIGIGAGAAAALLYASLFSGSLLALILLYLLPLPVLIASIGWSHLAGLIAVAFSAICLTFLLGSGAAISFVVTIGLPAWWLGYLALLARPAQAPGETLEWYPVGQIVLWASIIGATAIAAAIITVLGPDFDGIKTNLRTLLATFFGLQEREFDADRLVDMDSIAKVIPAVMAWGITTLLIANTWLAAQAVKLSGQLRRPWPDLSAMRFPSFAPMLLATALAGALLPALPGMVSVIFAGALIVAFAIMGFAVLHVVTRGISGRPLLLGIVYAAVVIFGWPSIFLALLGLAETALNLRGRAAATRGPPTLH